MAKIYYYIIIQNLTDYCLADDCYFIENGYNTCGFDIHKCNPVRQGIMLSKLTSCTIGYNYKTCIVKTCMILDS